MCEEYTKWCDKAVSSRLHRPVDPEYANISGSTASTFMGFFEGIIHKLAMYERNSNPFAEAETIKLSAKAEEEDQMRKTADIFHAGTDTHRPVTIKINGLIRKDDKDSGLESTSRNRGETSRKKTTRVKKLTQDVGMTNEGTEGGGTRCKQGRYQKTRISRFETIEN